MSDDYIEINNIPDYDSILNGLDFSDLDLNSLREDQFTKDIQRIIGELKAQGHDQSFIQNIVKEAIMRYIAYCRNREENLK